MKLEKAIEIQTLMEEPGFECHTEDILRARKLGIEAMKLLQHNRRIGAHHDPVLLPGETED